MITDEQRDRAMDELDADVEQVVRHLDLIDDTTVLFAIKAWAVTHEGMVEELIAQLESLLEDPK